LNTLKLILSSVTLVTLIAAPCTHARDSIYSTKKEVVLSENPPTIFEGIQWMALMCVSAYVLHKILGTEASQKQNGTPDVVLSTLSESEAGIVETKAPEYYSEVWHEDPSS
jgi:hypothetical protein